MVLYKEVEEDKLYYKQVEEDKLYYKQVEEDIVFVIVDKDKEVDEVYRNFSQLQVLLY